MKKECECTDECLGYLTKECKRIEEPKQETLEEVAERFYAEEEIGGFDISGYLQSAFLTGVKWQQERSYSEEELIELTDWYLDSFLDDALGLNGKEAEKRVEHLKGKGLTKEVMEYWFEKFKKK
jgi:hypothetical protein